MRSRLFSSVAAAAFAIGLTAGGAVAQDEQIPKQRQMQQGETVAPRQEPANKMERPKQATGEQRRQPNDAGQQPMQAQESGPTKKRPAESADTATPADRQQRQADQGRCPPGKADCPPAKQRMGEQQPANGMKPKVNTTEQMNTEQRRKVVQQPEDQTRRQQLGQQPQELNKRQQFGRQPANGDNDNRMQTGEARVGGRGDVDVTGSLNVSRDKANRVRDTLFRTGERSNVDVDVNVAIGTALPTRVRPLPLPPDIVEIAPEYRGYDYVIVQDEVVIVEPQTRRVVEVIRQGSGQRAMMQRTGGIRLTMAQRREILDYARERRIAAVQRSFDLQAGANVPSDIELVPLPDAVVGEVPDIRSYDFFVTGDQGDEIVLVDPGSHAVVDVIQ
ncbi:DUF1236 domain-containing protein [Labrys wisconsinensis]|uniref:DUF1236 domain-containing protein n=1 Tax=Labrys wisconsinensis TaxID=425677 RepID=A0ABU0J6F2_9HYPH|nr:DUF1236 domain-containing protein [Labrys wisconsinensis]MDQ0469841.1 hypothetical protein [Labrys wisconsinensis]